MKQPNELINGSIVVTETVSARLVEISLARPSADDNSTGCNLVCFIVNMTIRKPHHGRPSRILYSIDSTWAPCKLLAGTQDDFFSSSCCSSWWRCKGDSSGNILGFYYDGPLPPRPEPVHRASHLTTTKIGKKEATREMSFMVWLRNEQKINKLHPWKMNVQFLRIYFVAAAILGGRHRSRAYTQEAVDITGTNDVLSLRCSGPSAMMHDVATGRREKKKQYRTTISLPYPDLHSE